MYDLDRIRRNTFVHQIDFHDELASTNSRAVEIAVSTRSFPTLVLADRQTAGRGRGKNRWWTGEGALTFSLLLDADAAGIAPGQWPLISLTTGLAVAEAIAPLVPAADVRLKWPNDVFINGRKACGILVETSSRVGVLVIGIGLNVNNTFESAPPDLQSIATSLSTVRGAPLDKNDVLIAVLQNLSDCLNLVRADIAEAADKWRSRCYLHGRTIQISTGPSPALITGVCQGIDNTGGLLLQTETGVVRCVSGVVSKIL